MAQKLHDTYGFSYDNFKVLLGGWNTWKQNNASDPNAYPIETSAASAPGAGSKDGGIVINGPISSPPPGGNPAPVKATPAP